ncbi:thiamine-phosphate kinase [Rhodobacteraceae bacterium RKSG542]|uniref:thiamine-phosphate kinase n=1 Tax=Pseudovibrio flavus TaxID=2529854 RepID=UPI0012BB79ED|nr:thiamine-phosphate kinase [Pseudovibrio flavus]MTI17374.1 thiamine-phosphate kinase [Pseudovibrio flavus]
MDEFGLIKRYFAPLATSSGAAGLLDDVATLEIPEGHELVLNKDMLAADIHFFKEDDPQAVARKALRVNLSDIAAKGATPLGYLLGVGFPKTIDENWIAAFSQGLAIDQDVFGISLLGGDTIRSPERIVLSVTALGSAPKGQLVRRHTAQAGAQIYVTGTIGDSALGLQLRLDREKESDWGLSAEQSEHLLDRYLLPQPRVAAAPAVLQFACASMDISDGLVADLGHMCRNSGVRAQVDLDKLPLSEGARVAVEGRDDVLRTVITGGDDYEILCAVLSENCSGFEGSLREASVPFAKIGELFERETQAGATEVILFKDGEPFLLRGDEGFQHF